MTRGLSGAREVAKELYILDGEPPGIALRRERSTLPGSFSDVAFFKLELSKVGPAHGNFQLFAERYYTRRSAAAVDPLKNIDTGPFRRMYTKDRAVGFGAHISSQNSSKLGSRGGCSV